MNNITWKDLAYASILFGVGHLILWFQANSQFFWDWAKHNKLTLACVLGPPVSYLFMTGVAMVADATHGDMWATRILPSMIGTVVFILMTYMVFEQGLNLKNGVCLLLTLAVLFIQVYW